MIFLQIGDLFHGIKYVSYYYAMIARYLLLKSIKSWSHISRNDGMHDLLNIFLVLDVQRHNHTS